MNKMLLLAGLVSIGISVCFMAAENAIAKDDRSILYSQVQIDNKWSHYRSKSNGKSAAIVRLD